MIVPVGLPTCASYDVTVQGHVDGYDAWREFSVVKRYTNAFVWDEENKKVLLGMKKRGFGKGMYNGFGGKVDPGETVLEAGMRELKEEAGIDAPLEPCGVLLFVGEGGSFAHHITVFKATAYEGVEEETDEMRPEWFAFPGLDPGLNPDSAKLPSNPDLDSVAQPSTHSGTKSDSTSATQSNSVPTAESNLVSTSETFDSKLNPASSASLPPFPYHLMWKDDPLWIPLLLSHTPFIGRCDYGPIDGGQEAESGMQRWWVASVSKDEFWEKRVWEV